MPTVINRRRAFAGIFGLITGCAETSGGSFRFSLPDGTSPEEVSTAHIAMLAAHMRPTIVIGEVHRDPRVRALVARLLDRLGAIGYRTLGLEVANETYADGIEVLSGLSDEINYLRTRVLPFPYPERRLPPDANRPWHEYHALVRGWRMVPIDPYHWHAVRSGDLTAYLDGREPGMAQEIRRHHPCVAIVGSGHLAALRLLLPGPNYCFLNASPLFADPCRENQMLCGRVRAAMRFPKIVW